jgi:hypothetical protein
MTGGDWVRWHDVSGRLHVGRFLEYQDEHQEWARVEHREMEQGKLVGRANPVSVPVRELREWSKPPMPDAVWVS